jgi:hypothetical protein
MTPPLDTRDLLDLVSRKSDCLGQLRKLCVRQQELVDSGDMTQLLTLLAAKQRLLNDLHALERELDPFRDDDPARRVWTSEAERMRCASLADQSVRLLQEILAGEKRCEEALQRRRDETAVQLATVQTAGMARGAYAAASTMPTSTLDLTSDT